MPNNSKTRSCVLLKPLRLPRRARTKGVELVEFSLTLLPFMALITVLISVCWGIFTKSALQYAVKVACRKGITIDKIAANGTDLTTLVKNLVMQNSFGFLKDTSLVHVHYYLPPTGTSTTVKDVSSCTVVTTTDPCTVSVGNYPGNVMIVSVDGYSLQPLIVRIFSWNKSDRSASTISVSSGDLIEALDTTDLAALGTAP
jgi:Flp pilus assembly protein TadG